MMGIEKSANLPALGTLLLDKALSFSNFSEANKKMSRVEKINLQKYVRGNKRSEIDGTIWPRTRNKVKEKVNKEKSNPTERKNQLETLWKTVKENGVFLLTKNQIALIQRDLAKQEMLAIDGIAGEKTQKAINKFLGSLASLKASIHSTKDIVGEKISDAVEEKDIKGNKISDARENTSDKIQIRKTSTAKKGNSEKESENNDESTNTNEKEKVDKIGAEALSDAVVAKMIKDLPTQDIPLL